MKKLFTLIGLSCLLPIQASAANLLNVFDDAQQADATYHQIISSQMANKEGLPISIASLLPNISLVANPSITRTGYSGSFLDTTVDGTPLAPRNSTTRGYSMVLSAKQTIFDFAKFMNVSASLADSRGADATINYALQDLMIRVSQHYFAILEDEDNVEYAQTSKRAYAEQLKLARYQHEAGLKTITDVYTAKARYDAAVAQEIAAKNQLANDKENLWAITGRYYPQLDRLSDQFPLISPKPQRIDTWVKTARDHNWTIKQQQYAVVKSRDLVKQQYAGHLPIVSVQANFNRIYGNNLTARTSIEEPKGPGTQSDRMVMVNVSVPIFEGGGVVAKTTQANFNFQAAEQQLEFTIRKVLNQTRQSYSNIIAGISKIKADKQALISNVKSVEGMDAAYQAGTETLVNVLNQQEVLFQSQTQYAKDRYAFVNNILQLKQAAGTLSFDDLKTINRWLNNKRSSQYKAKLHASNAHFKRKIVAKHKKIKKLAKNKKNTHPKA